MNMTRDFESPAETERLDRLRELVATELPELLEKPEKLRSAAGELTLSGELRRAIRTSELSLMEIVRRSEIEPLALDSFLTGDVTLPSDAMDRLAKTLGYELSKVSRAQAS